MEDILYGNRKSYFNMRRFENSINNYGIVREKTIIRESRFKYFEKIILSAIITLIIILIFVTGLIIHEVVLSRTYEKDIEELEITLDSTTMKNYKYFDNFRDKVEIDNIKKIAYLELDMITPSSENTIYFEKRK